MQGGSQYGVTMKPIIRLMSLSLVFVMVLSSHASASTSNRIVVGGPSDGNYELIVGSVTCNAWDEPLCGPMLSVRLPLDPYLMQSDDEALASAKFSMSDGAGNPVTLSSQTLNLIKSANGIYSNRQTPRLDAGYPGYFAEAKTPSALPFGTYSVSARFSSSSRWSCSIYNSSVCSWITGVDESKSWNITWDGNLGTFLPIEPVAVAAPIAQLAMTKKYNSKNLATIAAIEIPTKAKVTFSINKKSKKICSKSGSKLKALKQGTCSVKFSIQPVKPKNAKKPKAIKVSYDFSVG